MSQAPTILVFNSGLGGLTVFREVAAARPDARYVYVADDAGFPYGDIPEQALITRVVHVIGKAIADHAPDLVVIACNTASTLALAELRARYQVPFVGTVPAIKPACAQSSSEAHRGARHAGDRQPRIHPRADPRIRLGLRGRAGRLAAARLLRGSRACRRAGRRCRDRRRDRALLCRCRRPPHRHCGARLHALSAAARALAQARALAGRLARSGAGDRAPGRRSAARARRPRRKASRRGYCLPPAARPRRRSRRRSSRSASSRTDAAALRRSRARSCRARHRG